MNKYPKTKLKTEVDDILKMTSLESEMLQTFRSGPSKGPNKGIINNIIRPSLHKP